MLTVAGHGYVGQAYGALLSREHDINIYDPLKGFNEFGSPEGVLICVSTPQSSDGSCSVNNVINIIELASEHTPILIKSTISLEGWEVICSKYGNRPISFSPEFLRANTAIEDVTDMKDLFVGGKEVDFWIKVFFKVNPNIVVHRFDPRELILAKYMRNSFLSLKVSFFNQMYDLCKATNVAFNNTQFVVGFDERIGYSHSLVTEALEDTVFRRTIVRCFQLQSSTVLSCRW
jgi:UDPglucose 6-dehydrogenase